MTRKSETVLIAVKALVVAALPYADVERNREKDKAVKAGGFVNIHDGELVDIGVDLSPLAYNYEHRIPVEIVVAASMDAPEPALDALLVALGQAIAADPFLGGLVEFLRCEAPDIAYGDARGTGTAGDAIVTLIATYATSNPLL